jgi:hypothetical protein
MDAGHGILEYLDSVTLASEGLSDYHESMSNLDHIKELKGLFDEGLFGVEVHVFHADFHRCNQHVIIRLRESNSREQITSDTVIQGNIREGILRNVGVLQSTEADLVFSLHLSENTSQVTTSSQDRLQSTHSKIVMELRRKLLVREGKGDCYFDSKRTGILESERQELDFSNHSVRGHHHGHGSEQSFEVIRELGTSSVTRIHGDVHIALVF